MDSPTGFIPTELWHADKLVEVRALIMNAPLPGYIKRGYFFAWARTVGVKLTQADVLMVENSGT